MRRIVFLAAASLVCVLGVGAQQHNIDTQKSTLTIHVGKTGAFSGLGHEHEVRAAFQSGTADTGSHPAVEMHVDARALRVIDKDGSEKDRDEVQKTMLGPEVLDSERHQEIVFKSTGAEPAGRGQWTLRGNLTLRGQTRPVSVQVTLKDGLSLAKILSAPKVARFSLRHSVKSLNSTENCFQDREGSLERERKRARIEAYI